VAELEATAAQLSGQLAAARAEAADGGRAAVLLAFVARLTGLRVKLLSAPSGDNTNQNTMVQCTMQLAGGAGADHSFPISSIWLT
jgi:hypothetical protein